MAEVTGKNFEKIVLIGGSAGALELLFRVLPKLNKTSYPIVIVLHRRGSDDGGLAMLLASKSKLPVKEVEDKDILMPGHIYLAPGDYHLLFEPDGSLALDDSEKVAYSRPSIDVSFESASRIYGKAVTGILLSGANADGTAGLSSIKNAGGVSMAQNPDIAEMSFMPQQAINQGIVDRVLDANSFVAFINS